MTTINVRDIKYNDGLKKGIVFPLTKDEIMSIKYDKHINTSEFREHIKFSWFKKGAKNMLVAPTGTGKTTCVIEEVIRRYKEEGVSSLIVAPLTDLVIQINATINSMAGEVISDGILGKSNSISDNHSDSLGSKWRATNGIIRVISSASLFQLYKNPDTRDLIRDYFKQSDSVLIVDEFSNMINDSAENYKKEECENLKAIMDMAEDNKCPIINMDATATEFDMEILNGFNVYDFRDKVEYGKDFTIKVLNIEGKDKKQVDKERIELMLNHVKEGGTVLMRRDDKESNRAEAQLINELYGSDICYDINSDNKRSERNSIITKSIYDEQLIPEDCKILLTTSLLDKGISLNNPKLLTVFIDSPSNTPEQLVQFVSRGRKSDTALLIPYNKKSNILGGSLEAKFDIARKYKERLMKALSTLTNDNRAVCNVSNVLTKEFDDLLNVWDKGKDISKIAVARLINNTVNKVCSLDDKLELAKKYRTNIVVEYIGGHYNQNGDELTEEELETIESMNSILKEKRKGKKLEVKEFIDEICTLDTLSFEVGVNFLYNAGYLSTNFMMSNKQPFDKRELDTLEYNLENTVKLTKELMEQHGVVEFKEALKCSFNSNNTKYMEIQLHSDIVKFISSPSYESKNGGLVKDFYSCIYKVANHLIEGNIKVTASELDNLILNTLKSDIKDFDINIFPMSIRNIKATLMKVTNNKEVVNRDSKGNNVKKTLFTGIKTNTEIYSDYVAMLNKLGVKSVKSVERLINKQVLEFQPF